MSVKVPDPLYDPSDKPFLMRAVEWLNLPALPSYASVDDINQRYLFLKQQNNLRKIKSAGQALRPKVDPLMQEFTDVLAEPLSKEELAGIGQPAYGSVVIHLYKIFRHFKQQQ
jgi:hypothetical protein